MSRALLAYITAITLLLVSIWCGVSIGSVHIPFEVFWNRAADETAANILWKIRLPRVLLAGLLAHRWRLQGQPFKGC
ncbi:ABC transporter permease OS=Lysinibacillus sphaericus OX=1421 GN=LS41612_20195 PE=3 SV=1 [Lysinibacillus sphaericus]